MGQGGQGLGREAGINHYPATRAGSQGQRLETGITVRTHNGVTLRQDIRYPLMSEAEIQQKFRNLVGRRLDSGRVADLERKIITTEHYYRM